MYHLLVMAALLCFCIIPERRGGTRGGVTIARPAAVAPTPPPTISDPCTPELKVGHEQYRLSHFAISHRFTAVREVYL